MKTIKILLFCFILIIFEISNLYPLEKFKIDIYNDLILDPDETYKTQNFDAKKSDQDYVFNLLKKYSSTSYYILYRMVNTTFTYNQFRDFTIWLDEDYKKSICRNIQVVVHEGMHLVSSLHVGKYQDIQIKAVQIPNSSYYTMSVIDDPGTSFIIYITNVFPSREIKDDVPQVKEGLYSLYDLYIKEGKVEINGEMMDIGTQINGIYGLLNEYNAYFRGLEASYNLRYYFLDQEKKLKTKEETAKHWIHFFDDVDMHSAAYQEFTIFILSYFMYAQKQKPDIYKDIINNKSFIKAFVLIEDKFKNIQKDFYQFKLDKIVELNKKGITAIENGNKLQIGDTTLTTNYDRAIKLQPILNSDDYKKLMNHLKKIAKENDK